MTQQVTTPYAKKEWYVYFNHSVIGFHFFNVFLSNYGEGRGTRFNDLIGNWKLDGSKPTAYSRDAVKKKLQEGVDSEILKRFRDDDDNRIAIYQFNDKFKNDLAQHIWHIQRNRVTALMQGNNHLNRNLMQKWIKFFSENFEIPVDNKILDMFLSNKS